MKKTSIPFEIFLLRYSAITRPKSIKLTYEQRMKMKADLNETRDHEKQMWKVVNDKRDVRIAFVFFFVHSIHLEIKTTTKRKSRTASC